MSHIEMKEGIKKYLDKYPEIINYYSDEKFDVLGIDSLQKSPEIHHTLGVKTIFKKNQISIVYDKADCLLALEIMCIRVGDPFLKATSVMVGNEVYEVSENLILIKNKFVEPNIENIIEEILELCYSKLKIDITLFSEEDYKYAKAVLVYVVNSLHHPDYYVLKELDRWNRNNLF